jgi:alkanesulfonate monooxygenase
MEESAMQIEFIGHIDGPFSRIGTSDQSQVDRQGIRRLARLAENSGIDRLAVEDLAAGQDVAAVASFILHNTSNLGVFLKHRIGAVAPIIAAQHLATLDQLSGGRVVAQFEPDKPDGIQAYEEGLARVDEYLALLKRLWANEKPFDYEGRHFSIKGGFTAAKPFQRQSVPLSLGGLSGTAINVAARHADLFALPAGTLNETLRTIERVRAAAASRRSARTIRFSYPLRPVMARGRGDARDGLDRGSDAAQRRSVFAVADAPSGPLSVERLRPLVGQFALDAVAAAGVQATAIIGAAEQVALAILEYCEIGVSSFHVHGFSSGEELAAFGRDVVPLVRRSVEHRFGHGRGVVQDPLTLARAL